MSSDEIETTDNDDGHPRGKLINANDIEWETKENLPYDEFDSEMVELCKCINEFPGVVTVSSCQGFVNDHRPGMPWHVRFQCNGLPSLEGYASIEFLVYLKRDARAVGFDIDIGVNATAPNLNGVCQSMYFTMICKNRHPKDYASFLRDMRKFFFIPETSKGT